jgi:WD40 repeat protein
VQSVAFSRDGRLLASSGPDSILIWDPVKGKELVRCQKERSSAVTVALSPHGRRVAAPSGSGVRIWDATTGQVIETLGGFAGLIRGVTFSPDGQRLAVASGYFGYGEVRIVQVTPLGAAPE